MNDRANVAPPHQGPRVEIVIVAYESWSMLRNCLQSVDRHGPANDPLRVWVVDNGRDETTPRQIAAEFPEVRYLRQTWNSGFSRANNRALEQVEAPYVLLLNPDAELGPGALDQMLRLMDAEPDVGLAGCRLVQRDGSFDAASKRSFPTARSAFTYFFSRGASTYTAPDLAQDERGDVDAVNGAFMFVRTQALREVGTFDERFWMYAEDLDLCRRIHDGGWRVVYDGGVTATHLKSALSGRARSPRLNWHFHRSMALYYAKHDAGSNPLLDAVVYAGIAARLVTVTLRDSATRARQHRSTAQPRPELANVGG